MWLSDPGIMCTCRYFRRKSPESVKRGESANHESMFASGLQLSGITVHQKHPSQPNLPQETGNSVFTVLSSVTGPLLK